MSLQIIEAFPTEKRTINKEEGYLPISEFFCDTIQGEGVYTGHPAAFLRVQGCVLDCSWCDTKEVWKKGNPYNYSELFTMMEHPKFDLIRKLKEGQHLVFTGGSPLLWKHEVGNFIQEFIIRYDFKPFIEVENECVLFPTKELLEYVDCWNNSPKLKNSENTSTRWDYDVVRKMAGLENSWFKFVVSSRKDWKEIKHLYLDSRLIKREQIILMSQGADIEELNRNTNIVVSLAIENNVRFSTRQHVVIWNKTTGV